MNGQNVAMAMLFSAMCGYFAAEGTYWMAGVDALLATVIMYREFKHEVNRTTEWRRSL